MESKEVIPINLKRLRNEKGLSQEALAKKLGLDAMTVRYYEYGKRFPKPEMLDLLANFYGVGLDELFKSETVKSKPVLMSEFAKKIMSIPDEIYDLAFSFEADEEDWAVVKTVLKDAKERSERRKASQAQA